MEKTIRGFSIVNFKDHYGQECSIQKSSMAFTDAIWLGQNKPTVARGIDGELVYMCRMHLTQEDVKRLLPVLRYFVKTGELCDINQQSGGLND